MKPVIILFNNYSDSKIFWKYHYNKTSELIKNYFYSELENIGDIFTFNLNFSNVNYYLSDNIVLSEINKNYKTFSKNINFNLEDLHLLNICKYIHDKVKQIYGKNRKYILIGHSFGFDIALLFSRLFKKECLLLVSIDGSYCFLDYYKKNNGLEYKQIVDSFFENNEKLHKFLNDIKDDHNENINIDKKILLLELLFEYNLFKDRLKYFNKKLSIPTLFFKSNISKPINKYEKNKNKLLILEKKNLFKYNNPKMFKHFTMLNNDYHIWTNEKYCDKIIKEINNMI